MRSLRSRAILGGSLWAASIVLIGGFALFTFFGSATQQRFDDALLANHLQVVVALTNSGGDPELVTTFLSNPEFDRPYSGSYWQAAGPDEVYLTSRSLFDEFLPDAVEPKSYRKFWEGEGPAEVVRGVFQEIELADGTSWVVSVAENVSALRAEQRQIRRSLVSTLGLIGALGVAAAVLLTSIIVRPLAKLREDVSHRWDDGTGLTPGDYPEEVAPLVSDINTLLARNREIVDRAWRQTADMAHALKTPSAILRNELEVFGSKGGEVTQAQEALTRIDAQLLRSLARIRSANTSAGLAQKISLPRSVERLARLFRSMHEAKARELTTQVPDELMLPMDAQDLEEVLGNLLENAFKYSDGNVRVTAEQRSKTVIFTIEDDGAGIPEAARREALRSGVRLDTSKPGTGLGLAIAADLLQAYGGDLELDQSQILGGLRATCTVPITPLSTGLSALAAKI